MIFGIWVFAHFVSALALTIAVLPFIVGLLKESGVEVGNYRQNSVVNMAGITITIIWIILVALAMFLSVAVDSLNVVIPYNFVINAKIALPLTLLIAGAAIFGFVDDSLGTREFSGFKGHFGALFKGRLTTGALKALGIPMTAIISSSMFSEGIPQLIGNALLIALMVNTLNLFDLRPGRALKVFIPLQVLLLFTGARELMTSEASLIGIASAMIVPDLKEKIMLGDTGSNVLGAVLGFSIVVGCDWQIKIPLIIVLIVLQQMTEYISISKLIEKTAFLRILDEFGRTKTEKK
jgi:UDP-GlcNAc:undecaprenyl-phosphate/decaprenyl-phosphate GlcNAc-1-phosphate transferase